MHKKSFYALDICIKMRYTSSRSMENKSNDDFEEENKMKKLFALMLALAMMLTAAAASAESLKVGLNAEFAPFEYVDDDGKITGFDVELITAIAEKMGMEVEIENMYFDGLLGALTSKMVDCLCTGMTITEERKASVDFADPYFTATQAVVVLKDNDTIHSIDDLKGKKAAVQDGTTGHFMAQDDLGCDVSDTVYKAATDAALDVVNGRADCMIIDDAVAQNLVKKYDTLTILEGMDMPVEEYGIAVNKDSAGLLTKINKALAAVKEDGTYDALIAKYFN